MLPSWSFTLASSDGCWRHPSLANARIIGETVCPRLPGRPPRPSMRHCCPTLNTVKPSRSSSALRPPMPCRGVNAFIGSGNQSLDDLADFIRQKY
jgi:hypothetical protein